MAEAEGAVRSEAEVDGAQSAYVEQRRGDAERRRPDAGHDQPRVATQRAPAGWRPDGDLVTCSDWRGRRPC